MYLPVPTVCLGTCSHVPALCAPPGAITQNCKASHLPLPECGKPPFESTVNVYYGFIQYKLIFPFFFQSDKGFDRNTFEKQMSVMRGQVLIYLLIVDVLLTFEM